MSATEAVPVTAARHPVTALLSPICERPARETILTPLVYLSNQQARFLITAHRWVRKTGRSVAKSETPQLNAASLPRSPRRPPTNRPQDHTEPGNRVTGLDLSGASARHRQAVKRAPSRARTARAEGPTLTARPHARTPCRVAAGTPLRSQSRTPLHMPNISDPTMPKPAAAQHRWGIEVCFEDGKELFGVGDARNRTPKAVARTVPFQFLTMDLTIIWYALHGHHPDIVAEHRARAPWYLTKHTPSFQDMQAKLRRAIIASQFQPEQARTPTTQEITQVQQAWAAAGL